MHHNGEQAPKMTIMTFIVVDMHRGMNYHNCTIANVVLCGLDLHFQGQTFPTMKIVQRQEMSQQVFLDKHELRHGAALVVDLMHKRTV